MQYKSALATRAATIDISVFIVCPYVPAEFRGEYTESVSRNWQLRRRARHSRRLPAANSPTQSKVNGGRGAPGEQS